MAPLRWFREMLKDYSMIAKNAAIAVSALVLATVAVLLASSALSPPEPAVTPIADRFGWAGPEVARATWFAVKDEFPEFEIKGSVKSSAGARVLLWQYAKAINGGQHFPTLRQQAGSCVGHGATAAVWYVTAVQIAKHGRGEATDMPYEPALYGFGREYGQWRISGDGSVGSWQALALTKFGVVSSRANGLPEWSTRQDRYGVTISFSGAIDRKWGNRPGVPQEFRPEAAKHLVATVAQVRTYEEVRDALANGYPVTVASMVGFDGGTKVDAGKRWGVRAGRWAHQMCFIGVDDANARPGCYCLNSWGADAHGKPEDDAPPGGFWVDARHVSEMVGEGDSFAYSNYAGYPAQDLDWDVLRQVMRAHGFVAPERPGDN